MNKIESLESMVDFRLMQRLEELILDHNRLKTVHPAIGYLQSQSFFPYYLTFFINPLIHLQC